MLRIINRMFIIALVLAALAGILTSLIVLFFPDIAWNEDIHGSLAWGGSRADFSLYAISSVIRPTDSPYGFNVTINTPPLREGDAVLLDIYSDGKHLYKTDCLEDFSEAGSYLGLSRFDCLIFLPYNYAPNSTYRIFGVFTRDGKGYATGPVVITADWRDYEQSFAGFSWLIGAVIALAYLFFVVPVGLLVIRVAFMAKRGSAEKYSIKYLLNPLGFGKTALQKFHAFLVSPYFWTCELVGIIIILLYVALAGQAWKSATAFAAFVFSGLAALIVPFLWCAAWWYADFREREPLRVIVTLFLWGALASLMAIGLNTAAELVFGIIGLSTLATFLITPVLEEIYKGSGLSLLSEHRVFGSVEDGIVFGFVIGMGFSFIEDWIYLIDNPLGSSVPWWLFLFFVRSVLFSANHGLYTAMCGGIIGYLIERKFKAPALGLLAGLPVAAFFHAMHNSGPTIISFLGYRGALLYCCFLVPLFDYGGFVVLLLFFIRAVIRQRPTR